MWFKKLLCRLLGHRYICLYRHHWENAHDSSQGSETTAWECERCGYINREQWDD